MDPSHRSEDTDDGDDDQEFDQGEGFTIHIFIGFENALYILLVFHRNLNSSIEKQIHLL